MSFTDIHKVVRVSGVKESSIENFLLDTPLSIQSIAYDLQADKLVGEKGIQALIQKIVMVNNPDQAEYYARRKQKTVRQIIMEKALDLSFKPILN